MMGLELVENTDTFETRLMARLWDTYSCMITDEPVIEPFGLLHPVYRNLSNLSADRLDRRNTIDSLCSLIRGSLGANLKDVDRIIGTGNCAGIFAGTVADQLKKDYNFVGDDMEICPVVCKGRVLIISDFLGLALRVSPDEVYSDAFLYHKILEQFGANITDHVTILNLGLGEDRILREMGVNVMSLTYLDSNMLRNGLMKGKITQEDMAKMQAFLADPVGWGLDYLIQNPQFIIDKLNPCRGEEQVTYAARALQLYHKLAEKRAPQERVQGLSLREWAEKECLEVHGFDPNQFLDPDLDEVSGVFGLFS